MIDKPIFTTPKTFRDYEQYKLECARAEGWNEAMRFIFGEEIARDEAEMKRRNLTLISGEH